MEPLKVTVSTKMSSMAMPALSAALPYRASPPWNSVSSDLTSMVV